MNNRPVIDLSLRSARQIIAEKGKARGILLILWFRLIRPACVGSMWAGITIYAYRYLLPFDEGDLSIRELVSYLAAIGEIASVLTVWMILARVAHPFASKSRTQRLLRRKAGLTVEPGPFASETLRDWKTISHVFFASHDANGLIAALNALILHAPAGRSVADGMAEKNAHDEAKHARYSIAEVSGMPPRAPRDFRPGHRHY
ncbi:Biofilm PGA synthesis auxiliary protein PgaD [Paraburkholderia dinghuensis]|uniref:Biofilm PGA synthesis auxiliary protein PgaD n=1 Tax=Paraburkholderia dinghuensis TaxID=2305225 RepID=A0A3N6MW37_9BURK|nr:Biofilm PGA synthesis auxiliary protein PgaD [Paraburkholderia dinghuensis]RQH02211.1 Biofilm PGA synthesis auxiliary protein PgaD [Paraburkholderia dinghuensis]